MKKIDLFIACICFTFCTSFVPPQDLELSLQAFAKNPDVKPATWGFYAQNLTTKKVISKNADAVLIPASSMKLFPCLAAMELFGPDHRFETSLCYTGPIENEILKGNLIIQAGGDPCFGSSRFREQLSLDEICNKWIQMLKSKGIKKIEGQVVIDESYFAEDLTPGNWAWSDLGNYFGASPCAFNVMENIIQVYFQSSNTGEPTKILSTTPMMPEIQWTNRVKAGNVGTGDNAWVFGGPKSNQRYIEGTIPPDGVYTIKASMPNPAAFFQKYFTERLELNGIVCLKMRVNKNTNDKLVELDKVYSPKLQDIVKVTLDKSINLFAEILLLQVAKKLGSNGSISDNIQKFKTHLESKKLNLSVGNISDGSGLSRTNLVSARQFSDLVAVYQEVGKPWIWEILPKEADIANLRCKSGYVARVRSFAGIVKNKNGQSISFGFIINGFSGPPSFMYLSMITVLQDLANSDL